MIKKQKFGSFICKKCNIVYHGKKKDNKFIKICPKCKKELALKSMINDLISKYYGLGLNNVILDYRKKTKDITKLKAECREIKKLFYMVIESD